MCRSDSSEEYLLSDFVHEDRYAIDTTLAMSHEQALHKLKHDLGPAFLDRRGRRVWFTGLDEFVQCGMITDLTRPIRDSKEFIDTMPKGKWSDYCEKGLPQDSGGVVKAKQMSKGEALEILGSGSESHRSRDRRTSGESTEATAETLAISTDDRDRRKDSAHGVGENVSKPLRSAPPNRFRSSLGGASSVSLEETSRHYSRQTHDKIVFVDDSRTIVRRIFPAIERNWHGSKWRISPTLTELLREWGEENVVAQPHPLLTEGSISSTLSKASPLNH